VGDGFGHRKMVVGNQPIPKSMNLGDGKVDIGKKIWVTARVADIRNPLFPFINIGFYFLILLESGYHNIYIIFREYL